MSLTFKEIINNPTTLMRAVALSAQILSASTVTYKGYDDAKNAFKKAFNETFRAGSEFYLPFKGNISFEEMRQKSEKIMLALMFSQNGQRGGARGEEIIEIEGGPRRKKFYFSPDFMLLCAALVLIFTALTNVSQLIAKYEIPMVEDTEVMGNALIQVDAPETAVYHYAGLTDAVTNWEVFSTQIKKTMNNRIQREIKTAIEILFINTQEGVVQFGEDFSARTQGGNESGGISQFIKNSYNFWTGAKSKRVLEDMKNIGKREIERSFRQAGRDLQRRGDEIQREIEEEYTRGWREAETAGRMAFAGTSIIIGLVIRRCCRRRRGEEAIVPYAGERARMVQQGGKRRRKTKGRRKRKQTRKKRRKHTRRRRRRTHKKCRKH